MTRSAARLSPRQLTVLRREARKDGAVADVWRAVRAEAARRGQPAPCYERVRTLVARIRAVAPRAPTGAFTLELTLRAGRAGGTLRGPLGDRPRATSHVTTCHERRSVREVGVLVVVSLAFGPLAFALGRWSAVAIPLVVWPVVYLGLAQRWWGGLGDGWVLPFALALGLSFGAALAGVVLRRAASPPA